MYRFESIITALVVGCVILGSAACKDDRNVPREMCVQYQECDPADFADEYESLAECEAEARAHLIAYRQMYGTACYSAWLSFYACASALDCTEDPAQSCATQLSRTEQECQQDVTNPCPGYVLGTDDDYCCQTHDPCNWADDQYCDCESTCPKRYGAASRFAAHHSAACSISRSARGSTRILRVIADLRREAC